MPFGTLLHFKRDLPAGMPPQPKVLVTAPLSGHFATLLRETVRTLLQDHDVYITDWHNARDVSLRHGAFGLDDYIDHMIRFIETVGPDTHVMAVCQPCVAALAATAIMAEDDSPSQPRSLTLMAGPVDCRVNPTGVNTLAVSKPIEWFEKNLISHVPLPHAGYMRRVYPGFVQLSAFLSMNLERHKQAFKDLYRHLVEGDIDKANTIKLFYDEYLAVNDLPAEFYLETVEKVFQTYDLPLGKLSYRDRIVKPQAIRKTALDDGGRRARRHLRGGPNGGGARPVQQHPALHEDPPHPDRRGPLRRVQRQEVEPANLPARARHDLLPRRQRLAVGHGHAQVIQIVLRDLDAGADAYMAGLLLQPLGSTGAPQVVQFVDQFGIGG